MDIPDDLHGGASCWLCSHLGLRQSSDYPAIVACQGGVATVDEGSTSFSGYMAVFDGGPENKKRAQKDAIIVAITAIGGEGGIRLVDAPWDHYK